MSNFIRLSCLLCASLSLTACAPILAIVGYSGSVVQIAAQVERIKLVGDGLMYVGSGKTITDHALSMVAGADCKIFNVMSRDPVCATRTADAMVDAEMRVSLAPATAPLPQLSAQAAFETDAENSPPAPEVPAGGE